MKNPLAGPSSSDAKTGTDAKTQGTGQGVVENAAKPEPSTVGAAGQNGQPEAAKPSGDPAKAAEPALEQAKTLEQTKALEDAKAQTKALEDAKAQSKALEDAKALEQTKAAEAGSAETAEHVPASAETAAEMAEEALNALPLEHALTSLPPQVRETIVEGISFVIRHPVAAMVAARMACNQIVDNFTAMADALYRDEYGDDR